MENLKKLLETVKTKSLTPQQLKELEEIITLAEKEDSLTKEEFLEAFEKVLEIVKEIKTTSQKEFELIHKYLDMALKGVKQAKDESISEIEEKLSNSIESTLEAMMLEHRAKMSEMDEKMECVKDGKDADETKIVEEVLSKIPPATPKITRQEIRDELESFRGDERLDVSAVKGTEELIKELTKDLKGKIIGGGSTARNLRQLHDVLVTEPTNGDVLSWDSSINQWKNVTAQSIEDVDWGEIGGTLSLQLDLQSALDLKANLASPTFTGTVVLPSTTSIGNVSNTEISYLDGVTSAIQTQLDGKQSTGNYITALTGDATATGPGSVALTLATVNSNVGTFNNITINAKGLATAGSNVAYLQNVVEDTTPELGGELDANGNNIIDLGDVTFKTGATGGTLRTGTSAADKFTLQAYDVNGGAYVTLLEADAGNDVTLQAIADYWHFEDATDTTKRFDISLSGATTGKTTTLNFAHTDNRTITIPDATGTLMLTSAIGTTVQAYDADLTTWAGLTPSANAQSLVTAANYAAMRTLLDLEAGTDFYSIAAADAAFQPKDATLTALAGLTIAANSLSIGTGADAFSQTTFAANTFPARASTGNLVAKSITDFGLSLIDDADATAARSTLGLVIGTNVQAYDADLASWAGVTRASGFDTFVATPSSANLASLVTDEIGTGSLFFGTAWTNVTFDANNFGAFAPGTWTVESADQVTYAYTIIGKTMIIAFQINGGVTASNPTFLTLKIPGSKTASSKDIRNIYYYSDDAGSTFKVGIATPSGTTIRFYKDPGATAWANNTTYVQGQICIEIQ